MFFFFQSFDISTTHPRHPPPDIWQYIQEVRDSVCDLESRLQRTKDNLEEIQSCMRSWTSPMFDRKDGKKDALLILEDRAERLERFYSLIRSSGEKIHFLLKVIKKRFPRGFGTCQMGFKFPSHFIILQGYYEVSGS